MFCKNCGKQLPDDSSFCQYCGTNLAPNTGSSPTVNVPPVLSTPVKKKRKYPVIIGIVVLIILLAAGGFAAVKYLVPMNNYKNGIAAMQAGKWDQAIEYLTKANYKDSPDLVTECLYHQKADYDFIKALEKSMTDRLNRANEDAPLDELVNMELVVLENYASKEFYDSRIKDIAKRYIGGLKKQKEAIGYYTDTGEAYDSDHPVWYQGAAERYQAAADLMDISHYFYADDPDAKSDIRSTLELYKAEAEINKDCKKQLIGVNASYSEKDKYYYLTYKNNTEYTFDLYVYNYYTTTSGEYISDEHVAEKLKPKQSTTIRLEKIPDDLAEWTSDWVDINVSLNGKLLG